MNKRGTLLFAILLILVCGVGSAQKTCSDTWGASCGGCSDYTMDSCASSTCDQWEHVEEVIINQSEFTIGGSINVTVTANCNDYSSRISIAYYNGTTWENKYSATCVNADGLENHSVVFTISGNPGTQWVRGMDQYGGASGITCTSQSNSGDDSDNDDVNFTVLAADSDPPTFSNFVENPINGSAYSPSQFYEFNITINDSSGIDKVGIEFNGVNYTEGYISNIGEVYIFNRSGLAAGSYSYYWWANDTLGNFNISDTKNYVVDQNSSSCGVLFNETSPSNYGEVFRVWSDCNTAFTLYRNGSILSNNSVQSLGAGSYNFSVIRNDNVNYSNTYDEEIFVINKISSEVYLYLNGSRSNITIAEGDSILINPTLNQGQGDIYVYNNGSLVYQGASPYSNLTNFVSFGIYNITAIYLESQNYTSSSETWWVSVTSYPLITLFEPQNTVYDYNESLPLNFLVFDEDGDIDACWYNLNNGVNTTITNCQNATFNVPGEGSYTLTIYVNDTFGLEESDSVSFSVDLTGISISISEPSGTKTSRTGIPIAYSVVGDNLTCWYSVRTSIGGSVIANTTLEDCNDSSFSVASDGDYVLWLFANNSLGTQNSSSSSFSVSTGSSSSSSGGGSSGGGSSGGGIAPSKPSLSVGEINNILVNKGGVKKILSWKVENNGTAFLNDCVFESFGEYNLWITYSETKDLSVGEEYNFVFDVNIPEQIEPGNYNLEVLLTCQEINTSTNFLVEVVERRLDFLLIDVARESEESVKVRYSIEDISGEDQDVELQFLLFDLNGKQVAEVNETKTVPANTKQEFETLIPIDKMLEGELNLLANLNSETFSTFIQESVVLGAPLAGFTIFDQLGGSNNLISVILVVLFLGFAFFIVKRIRGHKAIEREKNSVRKVMKKINRRMKKLKVKKSVKKNKKK